MRVVAEDGFDRLRFADVSLWGRSAVRVDVGNFFRTQPRRAQRHFHATSCAFAFGRRGGHVIGVGRVSVAYQLGVNFRAARFGMFELLQHDDAGPFAHHETVARGVEWPGGMLGIIVARAEGIHRAEAANAYGNNGGFGSARKHRLGIAHLDGPPGFTNGVHGRGAGRTGGEVRSAEFVEHGDQP